MSDEKIFYVALFDCRGHLSKVTVLKTKQEIIPVAQQRIFGSLRLSVGRPLQNYRYHFFPTCMEAMTFLAQRASEHLNDCVDEVDRATAEYVFLLGRLNVHTKDETQIHEESESHESFRRQSQ